MLLSVLLEKNIVAENKVVGKVDGICWQKGCACLLESGENCFSADRVKIKGDALAENLQEATPLPTLQLEKSVYDTDGKLLGCVQDAELTAKLKVKSLTLDNGSTIALSKIVANNDIVTVRANKPKRPKKQVVVEAENVQQSAWTGADLAEQIDATADKVDMVNTDIDNVRTISATIAPRRKSGDFSFLVGKVVDKNIFNFLGELMIRQGDVVTREVYLKARAFGKLTELCLHTK